MAGFKELSLVAMFDEICRCSSVLQDATAESKFVEFLAGVRRERHVWSTAVDDCQRKHSQLVEANASVTRLQNCVKQAQNMFDHEQKRRKATEHDLCVMNERFGALRDLILNEPDAVATDARQKVLQWSQPLASPRDTQQQQRRRHSSSNRLGTISESVGSLLSFDDLSVDYTEDDLEASRLRSGRVRQHHQQQQLSRGQKRVSDSCDTEDDDGTGATRAKNRSRNAKRRNRQRSPDTGLLAPSAVTCSATGGGGGGGGGGGLTVCDHQLGPVGAGSGAVTTDALVATTTVVVPHSGPVTATSEIRARSASRSPPPRHQHRSSTSASVGAKKLLERSFSEPPPDQRNHLPSAAPAEYISGSDGDLAFTPQVDAQSRHHHPHQQQQQHPHQQRMFLTPAPSAANQYTPGPVLKHFGSAGKVTMLANSGVSGAHVFYEKMIIRP